MKRSWLVQRLNPPMSGGLLGGLLKDNPFSFGGGLVNGGLSAEAMDALRDVWSFDYMGAAEYEWGEVPKAIHGIARDARSLVATTFDVALADVAKDFRDKRTETPAGVATVYLIARRDEAEQAVERICAWAAESRDDAYRLRDSTHLPQVLRPYSPECADIWRTCGWLELDNGFLFFTDEAMWRRAADMLGLTLAEVAS